MVVGELVWVRDLSPKPNWGLVIDELVVYLTDDSVMVSYEVLANSQVFQFDSSELIRFHYYNRHLYGDTETAHR